MSNSRETSSDRISALPDPIVQHILSFLEAKDIIKTIILSKRWRSVWAGVPILRFSTKDTPHFERFVAETLANYSGNKVEVLDISYGEEYFSPSRVDEWIRFATERKVEELYLRLGDTILDYHELPQSIYSNSSLRILVMELCYFEPIASVSWTSLKKLTIENVKLSNDALASILLGSPNLEYLSMQFEGLDKITITSSNLKLKDLVLQYWSTDTTEISAPHIHFLKLVCDITELRSNIKLINLSSLMKLGLEFYYDTVISDEAMIEIVGKLHRLQTLMVTSTSLECLSNGQMLSSTSPLLLLNCEFLELRTAFWKWDFHRIVTLLRTTPNLRQLSISFCAICCKYDDNHEYWESVKTDVKCDHLKKVLIDGFNQSWCVGAGLKFFTSMMEFLLKNAKVLEEITIVASSKERLETDKLPDLSEVKKLISSYPRASVVVFKTSSSS